MKGTVVVLRLGKDNLVRTDIDALIELQETETDLMSCGIGVGMIHLVNTSYTPDQIKDRFERCAAKNNDIIPVMVFTPDEFRNSGNLIGTFSHIQNMFKIWEEDHNVVLTKETCTLSLDELLDRVGRVGVEGLSDVEFDRLKSLSK